MMVACVWREDLGEWVLIRCDAVCGVEICVPWRKRLALVDTGD